MPKESEKAWDANGALNAIDPSDYPGHIEDLLDQCRESVEDLAVEMEIAEEDGNA